MNKQPLQFYFKELRRKFGNELKVAYEVDGVVRKFIGYELYCPSLLADVEIECLKSILGDNYKIFFQPNNETIYIE